MVDTHCSLLLPPELREFLRAATVILSHLACRLETTLENELDQEVTIFSSIESATQDFGQALDPIFAQMAIKEMSTL